MRKKWLYFFIVLIFIVVALYVWRYKQSQVFENRVPAHATKLVNVNLRQIENHLLFDFLSHPITYLRARKRKDSLKKPKTSLTKGLSIPRNILFYTNSKELKNNWFSSPVAVNDKEKLSRFLLKEKFLQSAENNTVFYTKANLVLALKNEQLILALKTNIKVNIFPLLSSLFDIKDYLSIDNNNLKPLINSNSDVSFSSGKDSFEANFKKGFFELQGVLNSDLFISNTNQIPNKNSVFVMSGKVNNDNTYFNKFLAEKKDKFNEITHLSLDSVFNKWSGEFNIDLASIEQKTDTIVSYEYDDDFNKVEIKTTQKKAIPTLVSAFGQVDDSSLSDYFYRKNTIQIIENDTIFTAIPVYKFLATVTHKDFELYINKKRNPLVSKFADSKLKIFFNTEKYLENPLDIPLKADHEKLLKLIKTTNLVWASNNQFSLKINLKDSGRNFLGQFIKQ